MSLRNHLRSRFVVAAVGAVICLLFAGASKLTAGQDAGAADGDQPTPWAPELPAKWRELPEVAKVAANAASEVAGSELAIRSAAWGDPGHGCFLVAVDIPTPNARARSIYERLEAAVAEAGFAVKDFETSLENETASSAGQERPKSDEQPVRARLVFSNGNVEGELRTWASNPVQLRAAACFYTPREAEKSAHQCRDLLRQFGEQE